MNKVRELAEIINSYSLSQIAYEDEAMKVTLTKNGAPKTEEMVIQSHESASVAPKSIESNELPVQKEYFRSPIAGVFYARPNPDAKPYVKRGEHVQAGQTLCIVEMMKIMNELEADRAFIIEKILKKDGEIVEFDEPIFEVRYESE